MRREQKASPVRGPALKLVIENFRGLVRYVPSLLENRLIGCQLCGPGSKENRTLFETRLGYMTIANGDNRLIDRGILILQLIRGILRARDSERSVCAPVFGIRDAIVAVRRAVRRQIGSDIITVIHI